MVSSRTLSIEGLSNEWPCESQDDWAVRVSRSGDDLPGMQVNTFFGIKTHVWVWSPTSPRRSPAKPDGLLPHEPVFVRCSRSTSACGSTGGTLSRSKNGHTPDRTSAGGRSFFADSGGTGFWHETYFMRGGIEAIYDDMPKPIGLSQFAPVVDARGPMFSARKD